MCPRNKFAQNEKLPRFVSAHLNLYLQRPILPQTIERNINGEGRSSRSFCLGCHFLSSAQVVIDPSFPVLHFALEPGLVIVLQIAVALR